MRRLWLLRAPVGGLISFRRAGNGMMDACADTLGDEVDGGGIIEGWTGVISATSRPSAVEVRVGDPL